MYFITQHLITMTGSTVREPRSPTRTFTSITSPANHAAKVKTVDVYKRQHLSSTFAQGFHHVLLDFRGFDHDSFKMCIRDRDWKKNFVPFAFRKRWSMGSVGTAGIMQKNLLQ